MIHNPSPGHISGEDNNSKRYMHLNVHCSTPPFTIAKTSKQPKCPSTEEWIKKMWCMCVYIYMYVNISQPLKRME